jgi:hypothetical protein
MIKVITLIALLSAFTGCGSIFGVREFETWDGGPKWVFMEGQDFHVGFNGIDNVEDKRGVNPASAKMTKGAKY